jgi:hypothetical protein
MMNRITFILVFFTLITACFGQNAGAKFDISGNWSFDEKSSRVNPLFQIPDLYTLTITQTDTEVTIKRKLVQKGQTFTAETILYLDGRGEVNGKVESKTVLKESAIIRKKRGKLSGPDEKYTLSKDGKKLTIMHSMHTVGAVTFPAEYLIFIK